MEPVRFHVTGFGPFAGVSDNPSAETTRRLARRLAYGPALEAAASSAFAIETAVVSEVSMAGADAVLDRLCEDVGAEGAGFDVLLHFGVAGGAVGFGIEQRASNEKRFRVPDERGQQPKGEAIDAAFATAAWRYTALDTPRLAAALAARGWVVSASRDPGRFLCSYTYFRSLAAAATKNATVAGALPRKRVVSLFVHVPEHSVCGADAQERFALELMGEIASQLRGSSAPLGPDRVPCVDNVGIERDEDPETAAKSGDVSAVALAAAAAPAAAGAAAGTAVDVAAAAPAAVPVPAPPRPPSAPTPSYLLSPLADALAALGFDAAAAAEAVALLGPDGSVEAAVELLASMQEAQAAAESPSDGVAGSNGGSSPAAPSFLGAAFSALGTALFGPRVKLVLVVRGDLDMGRGKVAAQCCHAALKTVRRMQERAASATPGEAARLRALLRAWEGAGEKIVIVRGDGGLAQAEGLLDQAARKGLTSCAIRDAGRTQVEPGSMTIVAVGPDEESKVDDVTGHLKLL